MNKRMDVPKLFRGVEFTVSRNGPDPYLKAMEKLELNVFTTYKHSSDIIKCLKHHKFITIDPERDVENSSQQCYQV